MASLVNSANHLRQKIIPTPHQVFFPPNGEECTLSTSFFVASIALILKPGKEKKTTADICHGGECKISEQNYNKSNPAVYEEDNRS